LPWNPDSPDLVGLEWPPVRLTHRHPRPEYHLHIPEGATSFSIVCPGCHATVTVEIDGPLPAERALRALDEQDAAWEDLPPEPS
jgi:hypothetical protein